MSDSETSSLYQRLGGAEAVWALVQRFYAEMERAPEAAPIRAMHAQDLEPARRKLYKFLR